MLLSFAVTSDISTAAAGPIGVPAQDSAGPAPAAAGKTTATVPKDDAANGRQWAFLIGAAVMSRQLDNPRLAALVARQFDCLTGENEFKPAPPPATGPVQLRRGGQDRRVRPTPRHEGGRAHPLLARPAPPGCSGADRKPLPRDEALRNLKDHIDAVVGHFKGKVVGWDVVNEAISDAKGQYLRDTPARRAIGDDYIIKAFEFAHAADPDAELYYNDYGNEHPEKRDKTIRLIRELKAAGVRLDAVGIQSHLRLDDPDAPDRLDRAIAAYAAEGVKVVISELDVDVLPRRPAAPTSRPVNGAGPTLIGDGLPPEVAEAQARYLRPDLPGRPEAPWRGDARHFLGHA